MGKPQIFSRLDDPALAAMIREGAVGVLLTDTVYGLVANAHNPRAVARLYALKQRDGKPGTTAAASISQLAELGVSPGVLQRVAHLWPNPLSVVLPSNLEYIHEGLGDSPFRVVADKSFANLLQFTGPLTTSSANHPSLPPATNLTQAQAYFGNKVDFYVDSGEIGEQPASTIVRLNNADEIEVLRPGAIKIDEERENHDI